MKKNLFVSKTFWMNIFMAILPAISNHPQEHIVEFSAVWGVLAIIMRMVTKDKVVLVE